MRSLSGRPGLGLPTRRSLIRVACLAGGLLLTGCASPEGPNATSILDGLFASGAAVPEATPPKREADRFSCGTAAQCKGVLKTMIDSPDRGWIGKQQSPNAYANGTRFFAYRALRAKLTCSELGLAVDEVRAASKSLDRPVPGMTPDQLSRTRALSAQVEGELAKERAGRCRT